MADEFIPVNEHFMTIERVTPTDAPFDACEVGGEKVFSVCEGAWYVDKIYFERTLVFDEHPREIVVVFKREVDDG